MSKLTTLSRIGIFLFGIGMGIIATDIYSSTYELTRVITATVLILVGVALYLYKGRSK